MEAEGTKYVYGPVPSKRLGASLGLDIIPRLTCTFNCVYCQLGSHKRVVSSPEGIRFPHASDILHELEEVLARSPKVDYITPAGSGEPTLNPELGLLVQGIREMTDVPCALITNSSLLPSPSVFEAACEFDVVLPSLDAGDERTFREVNRPARGFHIEDIAAALKRLSREQEVWLEVMLIDGRVSNTTPQSIEHIVSHISSIQPEEVHLNTPTRPPAEGYVRAVELARLREIARKVEDECSVPTRIVPEAHIPHSNAELTLIMDVLRIRPCTLEDIVAATGLNDKEVLKYLSALLSEQKVKIKVVKEERFYVAQ
ncbi:MAG: radical SAM protein [Methermicoccaceae archaeon]